MGGQIPVSNQYRSFKTTLMGDHQIKTTQLDRLLQPLVLWNCLIKGEIRAPCRQAKDFLSHAHVQSNMPACAKQYA